MPITPADADAAPILLTAATAVFDEMPSFFATASETAPPYFPTNGNAAPIAACLGSNPSGVSPNKTPAEIGAGTPTACAAAIPANCGTVLTSPYAPLSAACNGLGKRPRSSS